MAGKPPSAGRSSSEAPFATELQSRFREAAAGRFAPIRAALAKHLAELRRRKSGTAAGRFHAKLAAIEADGRVFVAVKANVNLPGNPIRHRRPTIQGALILLDGDDGRPLAIMDSSALTSLRTAAVAALAAEHLGLPESRTITIVGCGEQVCSCGFAFRSRCWCWAPDRPGLRSRVSEPAR